MDAEVIGRAGIHISNAYNTVHGHSVSDQCSKEPGASWADETSIFFFFFFRIEGTVLQYMGAQ